MIIRILTEGQYEVNDETLKKLDDVDNLLLDAVERDDDEGFSEALEAVVALVRANGQRLSDTALRDSEVILPPPDVTLKEARNLFEDYPRDLT